MNPATNPIVLVAHGAGDASPTNIGMQRLAERLERELSRRVTPAFNLGRPSLDEAISRSPRTVTTLCPLLLADGYFSGVLRARAEHAGASHGVSLRHVRPLGTWASIAEDIASRVTDELEKQPGLASVVIVAHGTERDERSMESAHRLAERVRARTILPVATAFLDQEPSLEEVFSRLPGPPLVVPFFMGGGSHTLDDVPRAVARIGAGTILPTMLEDPGLWRRVVEAIEARENEPEWRLGTRASRLALVQAEKSRQALESLGQPVRLVSLRAPADNDLVTPIESLPGDAPFADHLDAELARGAIDFATHSLKDLSSDRSQERPIGAYLERASPHDAIVSRDGRGLADLPPGAVIGTSSPRRARQLAELRSDIVLAPIRGPVDARIVCVRRGEFDAMIVAQAAMDRLGRAGVIAQVFSIAEMMPDAGQGAIAVQAGDPEKAAMLKNIDHAPTRAACEAEFHLVHLLQTQAPAGSVAAWARVNTAGRIHLHARLLMDDSDHIDASFIGTDPVSVAHRVGTELLKRSPKAVTS